MARIRTRLIAGGFLAGLTGVLGATVGCFPQQTNRAQVADDPEKDANATVGMKTVVGNAEPVPVSAVGFVYNLKGTGSSPVPDGWRTMLEQSMKKRKLNPKELLDDPNRTTSLVLVSATIPPGCRSQDRFDLTITLPSGSKTTSLRGGTLEICDLTNYEAAGSARKQLTDAGIPVGKTPLASGEQFLNGSRLATGEGPLVSGQLVQAKETPVAEGEETPVTSTNGGEKIAKVWNGGVCLMERPYFFMLNDTAAQPRLAMVIASRLNTVFHGSTDRGSKIAEAKVQGKPLVAVFVPPTYRHNHGRFLMVARQVPLVNIGPNDPYRKKLEAELIQPETAIVAAAKLEALGDTEDALRVGLESNSPWVQFASAQSLAYLGKADPAASSILAKLAERHPALRTHCLKALASQDDAHCIEQLGELMKSKDSSLRYGAFTAMRLMDENHESVRGRKMGNSFWMHSIAPDSEALVHLTTDRRNEIVLFGNGWPIRGPFSFPLGTDFTVTMKDGAESVMISRIVTKDNEPTTIEGKYRADLGTILKGIAEMGGNYGDAIEFIRRVHGADCLGARLAIDSLPRGITLQQLAMMSRTDATVAKANAEVEKSSNSEVLQAGYDVPGEAKPLTKAPIVELEPLNQRGGGRLFGPRPPDTNAIGALSERK